MPSLQPPIAETFNVEHYLRKLSLQPLVRADRAPPAPRPRERSDAMPLVMRPGGYRKLHQIKRIASLEGELVFFFNDLNAALGSGAQFKSLTLASQIPPQKLEEVNFFNLYEIGDHTDVYFAIERGPLASAQMLLRLIDEELREWGFHTPRRTGTLNNQGLEPIFFTRLDGTHGMESVKCIVITVAPWEFTPQDFEDFASSGDFVDGHKSMNGEGNSPPWRNADMMWAYLHDLCLIHDCQHFVLTSYERWAFGGFSPFLTTGIVSDVTSWDAKPCSVIEVLTYWLLSACGFRNTLMLDEVSEHPDKWNYWHEAPCTIDHFLDVDPEVVMALYHVHREGCIDSDLFDKDRRRHEKHLLGSESGLEDARPAKRMRREILEEHVGWHSLGTHISKTISQPLRDIREAARVWNTANRNGRSERRKFVFGKPSVMWNSWQKRRLRERKGKEKENASARLEDGGRGALPSQREFRYFVPCYSMEVDRENGRFRPEMVALRSFSNPSLPPYKPPFSQHESANPVSSADSE